MIFSGAELSVNQCCHCPLAVEFRNTLETRLGLELPSTLTFDYPSIDAITAYISTILQPSLEAGGHYLADDLALAREPAWMVDPSEGRSHVGVSSVVTRQPGAALVDCRPIACDGVAIVPLDRWDAQRLGTMVGGVPIHFAGVMKVCSALSVLPYQQDADLLLTTPFACRLWVCLMPASSTSRMPRQP